MPGAGVVVVPPPMPLPVTSSSVPVLSVASPEPDIQMPPALPSGVLLKTTACCSVVASYPMTQPWYGGRSQNADHAM